MRGEISCFLAFLHVTTARHSILSTLTVSQFGGYHDAPLSLFFIFSTISSSFKPIQPNLLNIVCASFSSGVSRPGRISLNMSLTSFPASLASFHCFGYPRLHSSNLVPSFQSVLLTCKCPLTTAFALNFVCQSLVCQRVSNSSVIPIQFAYLSRPTPYREPRDCRNVH
jgi:hypothetical protein